jgi:undecaprenyl diphosphate synthase
VLRRGRTTTMSPGDLRAPDPHPSGARPPDIPPELLPRHVALVMDGNGRWANQRGLPRIEGHKRGEAVMIDVASGAVELGVKWLSVYAFSTENWKRSPDEVRFLMGFNRDTIRRQVDYLGSIGVRIRWAGRRPKLWRSVIKELQVAEEKTRNNTAMNMTMCVNYGGRAEIGDAVRRIAQLAAQGKINPDKVDERTIARYLYQPEMPDVDLFLRPSGEQRTSNFLLWQAAYAEFVFQDTLFPDFDRTHLWQACLEYAKRDRRFGAARDEARVPAESPSGTDEASHPSAEDAS